MPGESFPLKRGDRASVTGYDLEGREISFEATGWFARCMQHEYDHLNGFLYTDRLGAKWGKKAKKAIKSNGWGLRGTPGCRASTPTRSATTPRTSTTSRARSPAMTLTPSPS